MNLYYLKNRLLAIEEFNHLCMGSRLLAWVKNFFGKQNTLKDFYQIAPLLSEDKHYLGIQQIPLKFIIGSVGRPKDYSADFKPLKRHLVHRWVNIAMLWKEKGWDAIQVFQIGKEYYVLDGHHRVSVANALGLTYIDAQIWEYKFRTSDINSIVMSEIYSSIQEKIPCKIS